MLKVSVIGATGFTGEELVRRLVSHPKVKLTYVCGKESRSEKIQDLFPSLKGVDLPCHAFDPKKAIESSDFVFLSLPNTVSMKVAPQFLEAGKHVVDISADYRMDNELIFKAAYGAQHEDTDNLKKAIYGLPELYREKIRASSFIANPGCYPTSVLLALLPLLDKGLSPKGICIMDAKSGVTGAGRKASVQLNFSDTNENFKAYRVLSHPHEHEIGHVLKQQRAAWDFVFVPHLLPLNRGILTTLYVPTDKAKSPKKLQEIFKSFYASEPFVTVLPDGKLPEIRHVRGTNQCHLGLSFRASQNMLVIVSAIDNLVKGAAGQAIQNMNIMCGFEEGLGLS
jgi:N-acetyl-gamma-glutamyl-phosphate reductase